jgi:hypothetical protein
VIVNRVDCLAVMSPEAANVWLASSVARTVESAPERWLFARCVRGRMAVHAQLQTETARMWLAVGAGSSLGLEWRERSCRGQPSRGLLYLSAEKVADHLRDISSEAGDLGEELLARKTGRTKVTDALFSLQEEANDLKERVDPVVEELQPLDDAWRKDGGASAEVDTATSPITLPPDLRAAVPGHDLQLRRFLARYSKAGLLDRARSWRVLGWRDTGIETALTLGMKGDVTMMLSAGGDAKRHRQKRKYASREERTTEALDAMRTHARVALFEVEDLIEALEDADCAREKQEHESALSALREVMPTLAFYAYEFVDFVEHVAGTLGSAAEEGR